MEAGQGILRSDHSPFLDGIFQVVVHKPVTPLFAGRQGCQWLLLEEKKPAAWQKDCGEELFQGIYCLAAHPHIVQAYLRERKTCSSSSGLS